MVVSIILVVLLHTVLPPPPHLSALTDRHRTCARSAWRDYFCGWVCPQYVALELPLGQYVCVGSFFLFENCVPAVTEVAFLRRPVEGCRVLSVLPAVTEAVRRV